jgi:hypothetical protein
MVKRKHLIGAILACCLIAWTLSGCQAFQKKQQSGAAIELNGQYIYRSTLDSLTLGLSSEDSMRVAQQYISQWAKDILFYEQAQGNRSERIEQMVEDYRRTLYAQAYEEWLVERRMPKGVPDSTIAQVYAQMPDRFRLDESIVKGILVVVPTDAPKLAQLRTWLGKQDMDAIEKYAYQNASGYELFTDSWKTTTDLLTHMPIERGELESALKGKDRIEISDSLQVYLLQITDKHLQGSPMPLEFARPRIEETILHSRQVEFVQKERERLYNEAIQDRKIVFF